MLQIMVSLTNFPAGIVRSSCLKNFSNNSIIAVHKIVRVVASRSIVTSGPLGKAPSDANPPGKDVGANSATTQGGGGTGGGKKNTLTCPKCGDPCTHVETFVCK